MKPPIVPEEPPPVLTDVEIRTLLATCAKDKGFEGARDTAIIRLLFDTGVRRAELAGLMLWRWEEDGSRAPGDVDLDAGRARVLGKGRRPRGVHFGLKTAESLDNYLRRRRKHRLAELHPHLWLARKGPLSDSGVQQMLKERGREAGLEAPLHAHLFRHTFAHNWKLAGGQDAELMQLAGWRSPTMLLRYGASAAAERALQAHKRLSPGDRL